MRKRFGLITLVATGTLIGGVAAGPAQQPTSTPKFAVPTPLPPLFFREEWRQTTPFDASSNFEPERAVTPAAVTNKNLELKLYDPLAKEIPRYLKNPPPGSIARDWGGPTCIQLAGYNQTPRPKQVVAGQPTDSTQSLDGRLPVARRRHAERHRQLCRFHGPRDGWVGSRELPDSTSSARC